MATPDYASQLSAALKSILANPKLAKASPQTQAMVTAWAAHPTTPPAGVGTALLNDGVITREKVNWLKTLAPMIAVGTLSLIHI